MSTQNLIDRCRVWGTFLGNADFGWQNVRILEKERLAQDNSIKELRNAILSLDRNLYNDYQWKPLAKVVQLAKELNHE